MGKTRIVTAVLLAAVLLLAACSGSDDTASEMTTAATGYATEQTTAASSGEAADAELAGGELQVRLSHPQPRRVTTLDVSQRTRARPIRPKSSHPMKYVD
jgi:hypothetical protein